ncbi:small ribosomal subunit protein mS23-like [Watersipora subatra]|uniref:small ribosomal subunit protein mS23-like n=1 Tax=Watersipora subatra TaxID=2589382 RepID=UPI00355C308A
MAGTRIERVGSVFQRVQGLYKGGVLTSEELPIWYNVWKTFPPKLEPELSRPVPEAAVKSLVYVEDHIRGHYMKTYAPQTKNHVNLLVPSTMDNSAMEKFVKRFMEVAAQDDGSSSEDIIVEVEKTMQADGYDLKKLNKN